MYAFRKGGVAMNSINIVDELGEMGINCCLPSDWLCEGVGLVWGGVKSSIGAQPAFPFLFEWQVALVFPFCHLK